MKTKTSKATRSIATPYLSNPFLNVTRSLVTTLSVNPASSMLVGFFGIGFLMSSYFLLNIVNYFLKGTAVADLIVGFSLATFIIIGALIIGAQVVVGIASSRGQQMSVQYAFTQSRDTLLPLIGLLALCTFIIIGGLFLFIIPGLIAVARLSLSIIVFYEEDLGPWEAIKRSFILTKGRTHEMFGALFASLLITGGSYGLLSGPVLVSPLLGRYYDFRKVKAPGSPQPPVHYLNYIGYAFLTFLVFMLSVAAVVTYRAVTLSS